MSHVTDKAIQAVEAADNPKEMARAHVLATIAVAVQVERLTDFLLSGRLQVDANS